MNPDELIRREAFRRRFSPRTIKTYQKCVKRFLLSNGKTIDKISKTDIRDFLNKLSERGVTGSTINVYHMSIKFLMEECLNKKMKLNIRYSKIPKKLPTVLSKEEIKRLLNSIKNSKHRFMIAFMYSSGLRVSELINLKVDNFHLDKNFGYVRNGKGGKDRLFIISERLKNKFKLIIKIDNLKEKDFLFKSNRNRKYSSRTIQKIVRDGAKIAKLKNWKNVHPHTLRHSFATHIVENGYDVSAVQGLLGHKSPETTMIYLHLASPNMINVRSPFDEL